MSQKRKISKFPPTEGETEDTTVIVEPTSAVQKRSRTTRSKADLSENEDTPVPEDIHVPAEVSAAQIVATTLGAADVAALNETLHHVDEATTEEDVKLDVAVVPTSTAPKKKSGPVELNIPSHLNPSNPAHFDHFLFYLLVVRAEAETPASNISKDEYPLLYAWIQNVKKEYKLYVNGAACQLTPQQILVLESLHVPLTSRGDDHWNRYYEFLVQYRNRHGHVLVPRLCETPGLGDWVTDQRRQYKAKQQGQASQMTTARQELLEALDFVWHVRNRPEWEVRFSELLEYKELHGDCRVPQHYKPNKSLGKWVAKQREQYKLRLKGQHSFLTPYREEKLNQAGFSWHVRSSLDSEVQTVMDEMINNNRMALASTTTTTTTTTTNGNHVAEDTAPGLTTTVMDPVKMEVEPIQRDEEVEPIQRDEEVEPIPHPPNVAHHDDDDDDDEGNASRRDVMAEV